MLRNQGSGCPPVLIGGAVAGICAAGGTSTSLRGLRVSGLDFRCVLDSQDGPASLLKRLGSLLFARAVRQRV